MESIGRALMDGSVIPPVKRCRARAYVLWCMGASPVPCTASSRQARLILGASEGGTDQPRASLWCAFLPRLAPPQRRAICHPPRARAGL